MGILAIGEYIKHWKRNVFVVIQISVGDNIQGI